MDHHSPRVRGQYGGNYGARPSRAPVDPHTLDYPASLKQYAEWFRYFYPQQASEEDIADKTAEQEAGDGSKPRNGIKTRWEKYKKEFLATQVSCMSFVRRSKLHTCIHVKCFEIYVRLLNIVRPYRSCKRFSIITKSHLGLPRNMIHLLSSCHFGRESGKLVGRAERINFCLTWKKGNSIQIPPKARRNLALRCRPRLLERKRTSRCPTLVK